MTRPFTRLPSRPAASPSRRTLVVFCHPVPDSFGAAARDAAVEGLRDGGHEVEVLDLYAEGFRPEVSEAEWAGHGDGFREPDVARSHELLRWCEAIVLVYPTWWSGQPAMLKGWFDRAWSHGVTFEFGGRTFGIVGRLRNVRRLVIVTTHGSSRPMNALQGPNGRRTVFRGLRPMVHPRARCRWLALYSIDTCTDDERREFLDRVRSRLAGRW